jgi:hypothetical protein
VVPLNAPPRVDPEFVRRSLLVTGLLRTNQVIFRTAHHDLMPYSYPLLDAIGTVLQEFPAMRLRIEGHADPRGSAGSNLELSERRAGSVKRYLLDRFGIAPERLASKGYGESAPIAEGMDQTALALNRRVEFRVLNREEVLEQMERSARGSAGDRPSVPRSDLRPGETRENEGTDQGGMDRTAPQGDTAPRREARDVPESR